tara:strand:- start:204 stop:719 length:516 start_codon:yes stop_codon:yes gene_type:complete
MSDLSKTKHKFAWHYTTGNCIIKIIDAGELVPATSNIPKNERPILWFSLDQVWELTANKGVIENGKNRTLTLKETCELCNGVFRVGIHSSSKTLIQWPKIGKLAGMSKKIIRTLDKVAYKQGSNPTNWLGQFEPLLMKDWLCIEVLQDLKTMEWVKVGVDENNSLFIPKNH